MTAVPFDFAPLLPAGLPAAAARWTGLAKYSFVGGNNDPDQVPVDGLIDAATAVLRRDNVQIGLAVNGRDPEQASCWFSVGDVDELRREYDARGIGPGIIDEQEYGGRPYRVFFAKEPYGVCFCFTHPL